MLRRRAHAQIDRVKSQPIDDALIAKDDIVWYSTCSGSGALCELEGGILCVSLCLCVEEGLGCADRGQDGEGDEDGGEEEGRKRGTSGWVWHGAEYDLSLEGR